MVFDLRRDAPKLFYFALRIGQTFAPMPIRRTNGAIGSFLNSYTTAELKAMLSGIGFRETRMKPQFGWVLVSGRKE